MKNIIFIWVLVIPTLIFSILYTEYEKEQQEIKMAEKKIESEAKEQAQNEEYYRLSMELLKNKKDFESMNADEKDSIVYLIKHWDKYEQDLKDNYQSQKAQLEEKVHEEHRQRVQEEKIAEQYYQETLKRIRRNN